ncbi:MAG: nucleotidyltransferase family protein [Magnetovibrio sp.]|nr:nucleotidyltransferase family protein [Magnetovibrio sp.]
MLKHWQEAIIQPPSTMKDAMTALEETAMQIVMVVNDKQKLEGVVTDGDVRRALLAGKGMDVAVGEIMSADPIHGKPGDSRDMLISRMRTLGVHHMPIIDADGILVDLATTEPQGMRSNWVVLMAGGLGSRLRPLTNDVPKPMLHIGDRPILETIIGQLHEFGFGKFFISLNYLASQIEGYFGDGSRWGIDIDYLRETSPLGTAGALSLMEEKPTEPVILMNGDLLTKLNFDKLIEFHEEHKAPMTVCVREYTYSVPYGVLETEGPYLRSLVEKPQRQALVNAGIYVISPEVFDRIKPDEPIDITDIINQLLEEGLQPAVFPVHEYWIDIGQKHDIERAMKEFSDVFSADSRLQGEKNK